MFIHSLILTTLVVGSDFSLDKTLPDTAIALLETDNLNETFESLEDIGLCSFICETLFQGDPFEIMGTTKEEFMSAVNLPDEESLVTPNGYGALALYPVVDYEIGSVALGALFTVELKNDNWANAIDKHIEKIDGNNLTIESVRLLDRKVWMISSENSISLSTGAEQFGLGIDSISNFYLGTSDGYLVGCTEPDAMASFYSFLDGENIDQPLVDNETYQAVKSKIKFDDNHATSVIMLENLADAMMQMDSSGMMMMVSPMAKSLIGDIDAIAQSSNFNAIDDMSMEMTTGIQMNNGRSGLLGLITDSDNSSKASTQIDDTTLYYFTMDVDFKGLPNLFQNIVDQNPMISMQIGDQMEQIQSTMKLYSECFGQKLIYKSSEIVSGEVVETLIAIECINDKQLNNLLTMMLPTIGAEPIDFLGYQTYYMDFSDSMPFMMPSAIDLSMTMASAGGYLYIGNTSMVQQALRSVANPKEEYGDLASNNAVLNAVSKDLSGWGYGQVVKSMEIQMKLDNQMSEAMFDDMEIFDPEMAAEFRKEYEEAQKSSKQFFNVMKNFMNSMSWQLDIEEDGFVSKVYMSN